jgi:hypothetical protein
MGFYPLVFNKSQYWYNLKPDLFIREPDMFRSVIFGDREQRGET